jgi:hypothetical protein
MRIKASVLPDRELLPILAHETLYLGVDEGREGPRRRFHRFNRASPLSAF